MCEGLCLKSVHSPCACWAVVQQRVAKLGIKEAQCSFLTLCNLSSPWWHIYTANSVCILLNTRRNYCQCPQIKWAMAFPCIEEGLGVLDARLSRWGSLALNTWSSISEQHHTDLIGRPMQLMLSLLPLIRLFRKLWSCLLESKLFMATQSSTQASLPGAQLNWSSHETSSEFSSTWFSTHF